MSPAAAAAESPGHQEWVAHQQGGGGGYPYHPASSPLGRGSRPQPPLPPPSAHHHVPPHHGALSGSASPYARPDSPLVLMPNPHYSPAAGGPGAYGQAQAHTGPASGGGYGAYEEEGGRGGGWDAASHAGSRMSAQRGRRGSNFHPQQQQQQYGQGW